MQNVDSLAQAMVDLSARGLTLAQIAQKTGMPEAVCHERMKAHLEHEATNMSVVQMRMLQLRRLEHIIGALWDQVMAGDLLTQGRNVKNLIDVIREITELMDLKKDRLRDEQVRLTQAHTALVLRAVGVPQDVLLGELLAEWVPERHDDFRVWWARRYPELVAQGLEENAEAVVKMGAGSGPVELSPVKKSDEDHYS